MLLPPQIQFFLEQEENQYERDYFARLSQLHYVIVNHTEGLKEAIAQVEELIDHLPESPAQQFFVDTYLNLKNGIN